jgi:hypothetical protein
MLASLDQIVGAGDQRKRQADAEFLGGFKVDYQFVLSRRLHRKIGRLLSLEDAVDAASCLT